MRMKNKLKNFLVQSMGFIKKKQIWLCDFEFLYFSKGVLPKIKKCVSSLLSIHNPLQNRWFCQLASIQVPKMLNFCTVSENLAFNSMTFFLPIFWGVPHHSILLAAWNPLKRERENKKTKKLVVNVVQKSWCNFQRNTKTKKCIKHICKNTVPP